MSKLTSITIGKSFKISKNYNSLESNMSVTVEIDENDNVDDIVNFYTDYITNRCKEELKFKEEKVNGK